MAIGKRIIETAMENGATLAGIASMEAIKMSASHKIYNFFFSSCASVRPIGGSRGPCPSADIASEPLCGIVVGVGPGNQTHNTSALANTAGKHKTPSRNTISRHNLSKNRRRRHKMAAPE
jgi:hypothetical protein